MKMAFGRTNIMLPLTVLAGFCGAYALLSALYRQPWKKNQTINEPLQDEPLEDDVQAVENEAFEKASGKSECEDEESFELVTEEKTNGLESLEDECTCTTNASGSPLTSSGSALLLSFRETNTTELKYLSACTSPTSGAGSTLPLSFREISTCEQKNPSASTPPSLIAVSALPLSFPQTNICEQKNISTSISPSSIAGSALPLTFRQTNTSEQKWKKNQTSNEPLQDEPLEDNVQAVENAAFEKADGKSECDDEESFEVVTEEKTNGLESLEDECTFTRTTASGSALISSSLYTLNLSASASPYSSAGSALLLSFRETNTTEQKNLSAFTSPNSSAGSALPLSFHETSTCKHKNPSASTSPSLIAVSALPLCFPQTNICEQKNPSASTSLSLIAGSALPLSFPQTNICEQKNISRSISPSSSVGSAVPLTFRQTNTSEQKEEEMNGITSARSNSASISLMNPTMSSDGELSSAPSFRRWNTINLSLTSSEIQDSSFNGVDESSRHVTTYLSPAVIASPGPQELTNELKMEIAHMSSQLSTYSETFVGLQIRRELGSGAFGRVYEADTRFEKVAIKVLMAEKLATLTESDYYMNMHAFYEEALLHSDLNHLNILSFEFIISDVPPYGLPGMATEFMSGDLYHFIRRVGGLKSWNSVWNIANQVANGLRYMHSKKVVHFDVKSSNILVDYVGSPAPNIITCKVADFGLAVKNYSGVMRLNTQRGTTHYMAPEVLRASHCNMEFVTEKVDVYSYGILLWELIMGVLPYHGMTHEQIGAFVLKGSRPPVPNCCDNGWRTLIEACWRHDQSRRPNFDQIVESLSRLLGAP